ncbi:RAMP superfamily CRISPR-associated protein [Vibrio penaeicida]|uniref:RAMP superfamily CRISPR-associated protein n=1 Tax=Vibrio penaeicida TaxID=104609 RepID=UPI0027376F74|nr:RAMP superfamily CRISPR-associated protein [Vibrio penaeicida]MDP2574210.1 RAMP superfamily CRISPR-associated protein [Vibrio penaeicida]
MSSNDLYYNVKIHAELETTSPLLIGNGVSGSDNELQSCTDHEGNYYIPGASIKGSLLNLSSNQVDDKAQRIDMSSLFGEEISNESDGTKSHCAGKVRFLDATSLNAQIGTSMHNSLNPVTRTTKDGHLYERHYIKAGATFNVIMQMDFATKDQLAPLLGLIDAWKAQNLGGHKNSNFGRFKIRSRSATGVIESDHLLWLTEDKPTQAQPITVEPETIDVKQNSLRLEICLTPYSPVFTAGEVIEKTNKESKESEEDNPQVIRAKLNDNGTPILPSTSVRGSLRAQSAKIYHTITQTYGTEAIKESDECLTPIYGSEKQGSRLQISEFAALGAKAFEQNFIGIDRFTGGVKAGANYNIERYDVVSYQGSINISSQALDEEGVSLALLLLTLRDLIEGQIRFGGYQAKGFGCVFATITFPDGKTIEDWDGFLKAWDTSKLTKIKSQQIESALKTLVEGKEKNHG